MAIRERLVSLAQSPLRIGLNIDRTTFDTQLEAVSASISSSGIVRLNLDEARLANQVDRANETIDGFLGRAQDNPIEINIDQMGFQTQLGMISTSLASFTEASETINIGIDRTQIQDEISKIQDSVDRLVENSDSIRLSVDQDLLNTSLGIADERINSLFNRMRPQINLELNIQGVKDQVETIQTNLGTIGSTTQTIGVLVDVDGFQTQINRINEKLGLFESPGATINLSINEDGIQAQINRINEQLGLFRSPGAIIILRLNRELFEGDLERVRGEILRSGTIRLNIDQEALQANLNAADERITSFYGENRSPINININEMALNDQVGRIETRLAAIGPSLETITLGVNEAAVERQAIRIDRTFDMLSAAAASIRIAFNEIEIQTQLTGIKNSLNEIASIAEKINLNLGNIGNVNPGSVTNLQMVESAYERINLGIRAARITQERFLNPGTSRAVARLMALRRVYRRIATAVELANSQQREFLTTTTSSFRADLTDIARLYSRINAESATAERRQRTRQRAQQAAAAASGGGTTGATSAGFPSVPERPLEGDFIPRVPRTSLSTFVRNSGIIVDQIVTEAIGRSTPPALREALEGEFIPAFRRSRVSTFVNDTSIIIDQIVTESIERSTPLALRDALDRTAVPIVRQALEGEFIGGFRRASEPERNRGATIDQDSFQESERRRFATGPIRVPDFNPDLNVRELREVSRNLSLILGTLVGIQVLDFIRLADQFTNIENRSRLVNSTTEALAFSLEEVLNIASQTRTSFQTTGQIYTRLGLATRELGLSQQELLDITRSLNEAVVLSGSNSVESSRAIIQLSQAIASGRLQGDELRSVSEQLPFVADVIARELQVPTDALRALGAQGELTTPIIVRAFRNARDEISGLFSTTIPTVEQSFSVFRTELTRNLASLDDITGFTRGLSQVLLFTARNVDVFIGAILALSIAVGAAGLAGLISTLIRNFRQLSGVLARSPILATITRILAVVTTLVAVFPRAVNEIRDFGDEFSESFSTGLQNGSESARNLISDIRELIAVRQLANMVNQEQRNQSPSPLGGSLGDGFAGQEARTLGLVNRRGQGGRRLTGAEALGFFFSGIIDLASQALGISSEDRTPTPGLNTARSPFENVPGISFGTGPFDLGQVPSPISREGFRPASRGPDSIDDLSPFIFDPSTNTFSLPTFRPSTSPPVNQDLVTAIQNRDQTNEFEIQIQRLRALGDERGVAILTAERQARQSIENLPINNETRDRFVQTAGVQAEDRFNEEQQASATLALTESTRQIQELLSLGTLNPFERELQQARSTELSAIEDEGGDPNSDTSQQRLSNAERMVTIGLINQINSLEAAASMQLVMQRQLLGLSGAERDRVAGRLGDINGLLRLGVNLNSMTLNSEVRRVAQALLLVQAKTRELSVQEAIASAVERSNASLARQRSLVGLTGREREDRTTEFRIQDQAAALGLGRDTPEFRTLLSNARELDELRRAEGAGRTRGSGAEGRAPAAIASDELADVIGSGGSLAMSLAEATSNFLIFGGSLRELVSNVLARQAQILLQNALQPTFDVGADILLGTVRAAFGISGAGPGGGAPAGGAGGGGLGGPNRFGVVGAQQGGLITGPGTGTSDSIPAALSNGEFVVPAEQTRRNIGLLQEIRSGRNEPQSNNQQSEQPRISIFNVSDPSMLENMLNSTDGSRAILNFMNNNSGEVNAALEG